MFSIPYLILKNKLATVTDLAEVDWFNYQYLPDEKGTIWLQSPGCFIEFASSPSTHFTGGLNRVKLNFRLHLAMETFESGDGRFLTNETFLTLDQLYSKAHLAITSPGFLNDIPELDLDPEDKRFVFDTPFRRTVAPIHNIVGLMVMTADYSCDMEDYMGNPEVESILANLKLIRN